MASPQHTQMGSNYVPGGYDDFYIPPVSPELISPEPQRHMPEMSAQIQHGLKNMTIDHRESFTSTVSHDYRNDLGLVSKEQDLPRFSPFPKLHNPPPNVPPSDEEFEETLWNARTLVLDSTDPEMQLAWAADALIYVGISADNEERIAAAKPSAARSSTPNVEHMLKTDAMNIVTFLSSQHHPKAEFLRGMWLEWGRHGQREDKKEAFRCYSRAADKGYARAEYRIGMLYESFNDAPKALRHYHRGVDAGDSASCYRLGMMTLRGQHGQQQDWQRAIDLIRQSAETADENAAQGAYVYGMLLARQLPQITVPESVLPPDEAKARMYIEKAAFLKFAKAQLKMGSSYELGALRCTFDPALSIHYYALAARQGEAEADMALSKWFLVGHDGVFSKNEDLSFTYAERAAATGLATAEFAMGYFYEIGMSVPTDLHRSMEWYQKASQHGNDDAKARIDALSKRQYLSKKDHEQVAITRIKSMHNSMRDPRSDRRPQPTPQLGQIQEGGQQSYSQRATSVAPYPVDDLPIPPAGTRPSSATPYPTHGSPTIAMPPHAGGPVQQTAQPSRPATTTYMGQRPSYQQPPYKQQSAGYGGLPPPQQYDRRYPQGAPPAQSPRPGAYPPQGRPGAGPGGQGQGSRIVSSPGHLQNQGAFSPQPSPRPGQYPAATAPGTPYQNSQSQVPKIDIGYSAPYEDRRYRPGPQQPQRGKLPAQQGRPPQLPPLQQSQSAPNMGQARPPPGRMQQQQQQQSATPAPKPPTKDPVPQATPAQSKPSKGPATFEEMGVHGKKNGEDCVMM